MIQPFEDESPTRFAGSRLMGAIGRANQEGAAALAMSGLGAMGSVRNTRDVMKAQTELVKAGGSAGSGFDWGGLASGLATAVTPLLGSGMFAKAGGSIAPGAVAKSAGVTYKPGYYGPAF